MKRQVLITIVFFCAVVSCAYAQGPRLINLHKEVSKKRIQVFNRELSLLKEDSYPGIRLSKDYGEGIAWLKGVDFSNGTLEFDVRGENIKQHSFVGIAFHGTNDSTFDAIYLRPFQFQETDEALRSHGVQYVSLPEFTWRVLRAKFPNQFEHAIEPAPDPNSWVHVRIVVQDKTVSIFINGGKEPTLVVQKVTDTKSGAIGFYVADTSGGDFANLKIMNSN